jgi:HptB-dependent secretion and biofilm anti anti-sigma factor
MIEALCMNDTMTYSKEGKTITIGLPECCTHTMLSDFRRAFAKDEQAIYSLNFKRVKLVTSTFLGMLLLLREHNGGSSDRIEIINLSPVALEAIKTAKLATLFNIKL